ncbi:MAG TPA: response regulator transcription factor [Candidatus Limnocylindrales bacterium]|nr:response regulator transcription factor [Candidatus Limnocylindrales bacterium]
MSESAAGPDSSTQAARRALLLVDRPVLSQLIKLTLNHGLFVVRSASDLAEATTVLRDWQPHIAVVDMDLEDSAELLRLMSTSGTFSASVTPSLGLTRRGDLATKLKAFDLGVDDIVTVPFSPEELLARAIVVTRRRMGADPTFVPTIELGDMEIDILNREVRTGNSVVHLTSVEQSLLYLLASHSGRVVTRNEIIDAVWGPDFVSESNIVDRHVRSLRIKLQNDFRKPRFIATVPGEGYRFMPTFSNSGWDSGQGEDTNQPH